MLGEFALRLAVALPLVCLAAAASLWAVRRGWLRLPGGTLRVPAATAATLDVVAVRHLSPAARVAVVRFAGQDLLLGVSAQSVRLLARAPATPPEESR
jgi:flagellar biogenesis protein FliO